MHRMANRVITDHTPQSWVRELSILNICYTLRAIVIVARGKLPGPLIIEMKNGCLTPRGPALNGLSKVVLGTRGLFWT